MIEKYSFGLITILGKTYNHDVEVRWTGEVLKWWRKEGHTIDVEDIERAIQTNPTTLVLGTGALGVCQVTKKCEKFIKEKGINLIIEKTQKAIETFNEILEKNKEEKIVGLFHLTC